MTTGDPDPLARELASEQGVVDRLYGYLDALRDANRASRDAVLRSPVAGTPGSLGERDALLTAYEGRLAQLRAVEDRLCFGRLDVRDGPRRYVGRVGLSDERQNPVLIDWRAPAAEAFYQATPAAPGDVVRRRHLTTRGRTVVALEDEVLDLDALDAAQVETLAGDGALMAALDEHRSGRMRDIVATIQAEQDQVVRSDLRGVLVVQGGPGTGKTAVALHRAAYLLYTHRERIARSGVLLVGPNRAFLRYIEQVLPSLGETGVVTATVGELFPGVEAGADEDPRAAALKGDRRMAQVVRAAVRARQRVPAGPVVLRVDAHEVVLRPADVAAARARARGTGKPHNEARVVFVRDLLARLADQLAERSRPGLSADDRKELATDLLADLRDAPDVRREVNLCWLPVTPQQLVAGLWAHPERLAAAGPYLKPEQRALLARPIEAPWTPADVPLLDEAAELLGEDDSAARAAAAIVAAERAQEAEYARHALSTSASAYSGEVGGWMLGRISAESLVDRYAGTAERATVAERAAEDRSWTFGHVVVDEAQELSPMAWRMLVRRCPSRSMTVVGDLAQTGSLAGARTWAGVLDPVAEGRWRVAELTVNYRTPGQVMDRAHAMLMAAGVVVPTVTSARPGDSPPQRLEISGPDDPALAAAVRDEADRVAPGTVAVVAPAHEVDAVRRSFTSHGVDVGEGSAVSLLAVREAKGLEYDSVVVVSPTRIVEASPRGANDLYVAMTRPTQRLLLAHAEPLPESLADLPLARSEESGPSPVTAR